MEIMYHGSPAKFNRFDMSKATAASGAGWGIYLVDNPKTAEHYARGDGYVYTVEVSGLKKSLSNDKITPTFRRLLPKMIYELCLSDNSNLIYDFGLEEINQNNALFVAKELLQGTDSDTEIIANFYNTGSPINVVYDWLKKNGYSHIIGKSHADEDKVMVIFDDKYMKIINHKRIK